MPYIKLPLDFKANDKLHIADLHHALTQLNVLPKSEKKLPVPKALDDLNEAIKAFKTENNLGKTATLNAKTIEGLNVALHDKFITANKSRVSNLHNMLAKIDMPIDKAEVSKRSIGESTRNAIVAFQKANNLPEDGKISESLFQKLDATFIDKTFAAKIQVNSLQKDLLTIRRIAKIEDRIDEAELQKKEIGRTTTAFIQKFQAKYKLESTGKLDRATLDKIQSVVTSRGIATATLKKINTQDVQQVKRALRLNMVHKDVMQAQLALTNLGFSIAEKEYKTTTFGKTTQQAVLAFQKSKGLPQTGHLAGKTLKTLNLLTLKINPSADSGLKYRIRGSVRDELWNRTNNMVLKIYEKLVDGKSKEPLMTKKNMLNGFFDITYNPPKDPNNGQIKAAINLVIELYSSVNSNPANDVFISSKIINNVPRIQWVNFTLGEDKYKGDSDFYTSMRLIGKYKAGDSFEGITEKPDNKQITQLSTQTGLSTDDIMRLLLSHKIAKSVGNAVLTAEVFYAFLRQNMPSQLPSDLFFPVSTSWDAIDTLVESAESGIGFLDTATHTAIIETAIAENLVTRLVFKNKEAVLKALANLQIQFALSKPILVGNGNIQTLLNHSTLDAAQAPVVAQAFLQNNGFNEAFWQTLETNSSIKPNQLEDLKTTVDLGGITKNFEPILQAFKKDISNNKFSYIGDIAKLTHKELEEYIKANGNTVPNNLGGTLAESITAYANAIKLRSESLYPAIAFTAAIKNSDATLLKNLDKVVDFFDKNPAFKIKEESIGTYLNKTETTLDAATKASISTVARVYRIANDAATGTTLIENNLHSSMQIYFAGKNNLIAKGLDKLSAERVFETAKTQYSQVLGKLIQLMPQINLGTPAAISKQTYTAAEIKEWIGDVPDIEALFGNLDFCECEHCKSLYGPAAYLTDMLRFLKTHPSLIVGKNVKDILFERRPDLGNIKLNCENTNTPIPYIDLVCEVLENTISPLPPNANFNFQTTLSKKELRAMPQNVREDAYTTLAAANFPMQKSFNLWQEEARTYLKYLGIPRYYLMEKYRDISNINNKIPSDVDIAAEYFGIAVFEKAIIVSPRATKVDQEKYWGFDAVKDKVWQDAANLNKGVSVQTFMQRSQLTYNEVLELLLVKLINPSGATQSKIVRPIDTCSTDVQFINNLDFDKLDLMHRFIRLWRSTGWAMWELDLLLQNGKIGKNKIDADALVNLKAVKQIQEALPLSVEILVAFYENVNTQQRIRPENPTSAIPSLYDALFQNPTITRPIDTHFALPLNNAITLGINTVIEIGYTPIPTILSALSINQEEFDLLIAKTDGHLSLNSISVLLRHTYLAKAMRLSIANLLLLTQTNLIDAFAHPQATLDFIKSYEYIKNSSFSINELDYVLNYNPASAVGWRDEAYTQLLSNLITTQQSSKDSLAKLQLTTAEQTTILNFNANAITALPDNQVIANIAPLKAIFNAKQAALDDAKFAPEQRLLITSFNDAAPIAATRKTKLIDNIKALQIALQNMLNDGTVQLQALLSNAYTLPNSQVVILLKIIFPALSPKTVKDILSDEAILQPSPDVSKQRLVLMLLHKIALVLNKMNIDEVYFKWFADNFAAISTLNFAALPIQVGGANQYTAWLNLYKFNSFKNKYPQPENASLISILNTAINNASTKSNIIAEINKITQWDSNTSSNLKNLDEKIKLTKTNYLEADTYERLQQCFEIQKITGVDTNTIFGWNDTANNIAATQTRLTIKSKFESEDWLEKITPLQDDLREKKRKALVDYFIEFSLRSESQTVVVNSKTIPNPKYWHDANALFKYYLIDVEMSACQLTSRIKQAISSVQFFVQRCFLNVENRFVQVSQGEKDDTASPNAWSQWKWMKNYRIWEANRKVFFYPENWIEPELRDDKSKFFEELENDILQNEITHTNVEGAFLTYLHKIDEVSHLEVCGTYHEQEDLSPSEVGYERDWLHVVGRTKTEPHIYYYRKYDANYSTWTAWEKIDLDITGEHLVPVVYNRKLHIFWLVAQQKVVKVTKTPAAVPSTSAKPQDTTEPAQYWEIQLAWSVLKHTGWAAKKVAKEKLIHPWERPISSYLLKPYYFAKLNQLYLDIYLSTSAKFNEGNFYDQFTGQRHKLTKNPYNQTFLPWHSSSFVFDGELQAIKLKPLQYYFDFNFFGLNFSLPSGLNSWHLVHKGFGEDGKKIELLNIKDYGPRLRLPNGMHFENNMLTNNQVHNINNSQLNILVNGANMPLLSNASNPFKILTTQQDQQFNAAIHPLFYQDKQRAFFVKPETIPLLNNYNQQVGSIKQYRFKPFYHPYSQLFVRELNRKGLDGLLNRKIQVNPQAFPPANTFNFSGYAPIGNTIVDDSAKNDVVDFSFGGAFSIYNWELFFHAPLMIANKLSQNQRFEEAMRWYHYIFDPTNIESLPTPQRYWITKPFFEYNADNYRKQRIESILKNIGDKENSDQLKAWRNNPFKPHLIARYRPVAYQKTVVMKYIDNLIGWSDMLFRRDTIEAINEASMLYMLAYEILGDRPIKVPNISHEDKSFNEIEAKLDAFGNAQVDVVLEDTTLPIQVIASSDDTEAMPKIETFYFGIPNNDVILKYWDTVEDRLFKIRRCMNIEGVVRQLPLFEPPIDPALLVKAAAAGIDLNSVLNDIAAGTPYYRFRVTIQKAIEFCNEVKILGEKLINTIEKKDIEQLNLLRSKHEIHLLTAVKEVRKKQIDEAVENIGGLNKAFEIAAQKESYLNSIPRMNTWEDLGAVAHGLGIVSEIVSTVLNMSSAGAHLIPQLKLGISGFGGTPSVNAEFGGREVGDSLGKFAGLFQGISTILHSSGSMLETQGSYTRRDDENKQQAKLASIEKDQIQFQINAAEIRQAIAELELSNQELQIEQAIATDEYMRNKYSNTQLYSWMLTQVSTIYFQAYQLAYNMAKKAEKCYQYELGNTNTSFVQPVYWDSLKKGLLSGDKLMHDLRKMEAAYIDNNKRELEIRKHISLGQMFPLQLIQLKETGRCTLALPEWLFNMDYPGHYFRRIKSVSISIPCIVGPYTSINCTLSLLKSTIRIDPTGAQYEATDPDDSRFQTKLGAITSIATSHAQSDSGMFELNFNDERYLPFEGLGAESEWLIELPKDNNYFDFESLADVVLHISYTARNGGEALATKAMLNLKNDKLPKNVTRLFSLKHEFPNEWYQLMNPNNGVLPELVINIQTENYPFFTRSLLNTVQIKTTDIWIEGTGNINADIRITSGALLTNTAINTDPVYNNVAHLTLAAGMVSPTGQIRIKINTPNVLDMITNIYLLVQSS